jgi:hypothetical protein
VPALLQLHHPALMMVRTNAGAAVGSGYNFELYDESVEMKLKKSPG